jgi:hypothetical protein
MQPEIPVKMNPQLLDIPLTSKELPVNASGKGQRIRSIDSLKGLSILLVILAHMAMVNLSSEWRWLYHIVYLVLDVFGPSMFVFLSSLSVVISIANRQESGMKDSAIIKQNGSYKLSAKKAIFGRSILIFFMGIIPNILLNYRFGILGFWYWFVLQFIAFSQIVTYYAMKLQKHTRIIIAFLVIFIITPRLFDWVTIGMAAAGIDYRSLQIHDLHHPAAFIFWLLFYPMYMTPFLPWVAIPLIASIIGEALVQTMRSGTISDRRAFMKMVLGDGVILIAIAIFFGSKIVQEDYGLKMIEGINTSPYFKISGLPEFMVLHSSINILYNVGMGLVILGIAFYILEIKEFHGKLTFLFLFFGRFSLSYFLIHPIFGFWFSGRLNPMQLFVYVALVWTFLYYLVKLMITRYDGVGTIEFYMVKWGKLKSQAIKQFQEHIAVFKQAFDIQREKILQKRKKSRN